MPKNFDIDDQKTEAMKNKYVSLRVRREAFISFKKECESFNLSTSSVLHDFLAEFNALEYMDEMKRRAETKKK
jgi:hypothetical protein